VIRLPGQVASDSAVIPYAPKARNTTTEADQLDKAAHAIAGLVGRAANATEADLRAARQATDKLTDQLNAANKQIIDGQTQILSRLDRSRREVALSNFI
jgi:hypothetical protein